MPIKFFAAILAVVLPTPVPSEKPPLRTIITVISSPYCNSLANHFNGALVPMLGNDRTLDATSVQLDDLNTLFDHPNYVQRYLHVRDNILKEETALNESLDQIQAQINQLRDGSRLTTDPAAAAQIHEAAQDLQTAYDHQRQLAIDLQSMYQYMQRYPIQRANPALGGFDPTEMREPAAMLNIKSYLRFDSQRATIDSSETKAVDIAYTAAENNCIPKK